MGIASAVLPLVWPPREMNRQLQRGISLAFAVVGSTLLLYVLTGSPRGASIGLYLAIAGYIAIWLGLVREYLLPMRTGQVALA